MRTAKEMLLIAKKAHYYISYVPDKEREIMSLIVAEAGKGKTSIYTGLSICDELKARLEQYGYDVSEPMYANEEEGVYESCVSWGDEL